MNIYEKLLAARLAFHQTAIKKSGYNSFAKYDYFELGDFVLPILRLCQEHRLFTRISFDKDTATLTVVDLDKPEDTLVFTSPMGKAELKGTHEIQQIGAVETYQRRYLYVLMMDIVEHDAIDSGTHGGPAPADPYAEMDAAKTLKELQTVFADAYQSTTGDAQKKIKAYYDQRKAEMVQKAD